MHNDLAVAASAGGKAGLDQAGTRMTRAANLGRQCETWSADEGVRMKQCLN